MYEGFRIRYELFRHSIRPLPVGDLKIEDLEYLLSRTIRYNSEARRDGREAEGGGLLNRYRAKSSIEGSNPSLSARQSAHPFLSTYKTSSAIHAGTLRMRCARERISA